MLNTLVDAAIESVCRFHANVIGGGGAIVASQMDVRAAFDLFLRNATSSRTRADPIGRATGFKANGAARTRSSRPSDAADRSSILEAFGDQGRLPALQRRRPVSGTTRDGRRENLQSIEPAIELDAYLFV